MANLFKGGLEARRGDGLGANEVEVAHNLLHVPRTSLILDSFLCPPYHSVQYPDLSVIT